MYAVGTQLAQSRPADTNNTTVLTPNADIEVTKIFVANTTGSPATYRIFHDNDGTTFDQSTALFYDVSVAANTTEVIEAGALGNGILVDNGGNLAVRTSTASALTFTLYGVTQQVAFRNSGSL